MQLACGACLANLKRLVHREDPFLDTPKGQATVLHTKKGDLCPYQGRENKTLVVQDMHTQWCSGNCTRCGRSLERLLRHHNTKTT